MKVEKAKVIVTCPGRNFVTLKIYTNEGVYGLGDATLNGREKSVVSYLEDHVIPCLIGRDPSNIEDIWQYLYKGAYWRRGPVTMAAALHFDLTINNFGIQEHMPHEEIVGEVFSSAYSFSEGFMYPGDEPGLGVDIDEEKAGKYLHERAYLPVNRKEDGTLFNW